MSAGPEQSRKGSGAWSRPGRDARRQRSDRMSARGWSRPGKDASRPRSRGPGPSQAEEPGRGTLGLAIAHERAGPRCELCWLGSFCYLVAPQTVERLLPGELAREPRQRLDLGFRPRPGIGVSDCDGDHLVAHRAPSFELLRSPCSEQLLTE